MVYPENYEIDFRKYQEERKDFEQLINSTVFQTSTPELVVGLWIKFMLRLNSEIFNDFTYTQVVNIKLWFNRKHLNFILLELAIYGAVKYELVPFYDGDFDENYDVCLILNKEEFSNHIRLGPFRNYLSKNKRINRPNLKRKPLTRSIRHEVFKRDNYRCVECGATNKDTRLHVDHIIPVAQGGTDELDNLQTLCEACNLSKSNRAWKGGN